MTDSTSATAACSHDRAGVACPYREHDVLCPQIDYHERPATAAAYQPCGATRQVGARGLVVVLVCTKRHGHRGEHNDERENAYWRGDDR